jgi:hypothetical protein
MIDRAKDVLRGSDEFIRDAELKSVGIEDLEPAEAA